MDERHVDDVFGLRPVPRRHKNGNLKGNSQRDRLRGMYSCPEGRICVYIIGPDSDEVSKVGVSAAPYRRLSDLGLWNGMPLRICYFAEVSRSEGFAIEAEFHALMRSRGQTVKGEWVAGPREKITGQIREIINDLGIVPSHQAGDTGDARPTDRGRPWESVNYNDVPSTVGRRFRLIR